LVSTDEHGTAIQVKADAEGLTAPGGGAPVTTVTLRGTPPGTLYHPL